MAEISTDQTIQTPASAASDRSTGRAMNLAMTEGVALAHCSSAGIAVSAIESLPAGGVRLVCSSSDGAAQMRHKFKGKLLKVDAARNAFRPTRPLW